MAPVACVALVTGIVGELNGPAESGDTNRAPAVGAVGGERVPVYDSPEARWTVGTIQGPTGSVACQDQFLFEPYDAHGRVSDWWVQARADNGRWGWAPAVALADIGDWAPVPGCHTRAPCPARAAAGSFPTVAGTKDRPGTGKEHR